MKKVSRFNKLLINAVEISNKFGILITSDEIISSYSEEHRHWHTLDHLYDFLNQIEESYIDKKINYREYCILLISAIFHDIIYDPKRKDNEEKSVDFMMSKLDKNKISDDLSEWRREEDLKKIISIILNTKTHESKDGLCKKFNKIDTGILDAQFIDMLDWENKIYKEYKWVGWKKYKKKRIEFLLRSIKDHTHNVINIKNLIDYLNNKSPKIGICYYEIDNLPLIEDYVSTIKKTEKLFDVVIILITYKNDKYSKELIEKYSKNAMNNDFKVLRENEFVEYLKHQKGYITIVKDVKYNDMYKDYQINDDVKIIFI